MRRKQLIATAGRFSTVSPLKLPLIVRLCYSKSTVNPDPPNPGAVIEIKLPLVSS